MLGSRIEPSLTPADQENPYQPQRGSDRSSSLACSYVRGSGPSAMPWPAELPGGGAGGGGRRLDVGSLNQQPGRPPRNICTLRHDRWLRRRARSAVTCGKPTSCWISSTATERGDLCAACIAGWHPTSSRIGDVALAHAYASTGMITHGSVDPAVVGPGLPDCLVVARLEACRIAGWARRLSCWSFGWPCAVVGGLVSLVLSGERACGLPALPCPGLVLPAPRLLLARLPVRSSRAGPGWAVTGLRRCRAAPR